MTMADQRSRGPRRPRSSGPEPVRITTAATSRAEEQAGRQRRYIISMAIRTLCVVGAVVVGDTWWRWVLLAGAVFLPYVAVVMANTTDTRDDGFDLPDGTYRRALTGGDDHRS